MGHADATTSEEIEIAQNCHFDRRRRDGAILKAAIRTFAGLPRLTGLDGAKMIFEESGKGTLLGYNIHAAGCVATGFVPVHDGDRGAAKEFDRIARKLEKGIRAEGATAYADRKTTHLPWAFTASALLVAAIEQAGVDPAEYLARIHQATRHRSHPGTTRHGAPIQARPKAGPVESRAADEPRNDLPWDLPDHLVSMTGFDVELHEIRVGVGAVWGKRLHRDRDPALSVKGVLPQTMRIGAVGHPLNRLVDHPLLASIDTPVDRVLQNGGSTVLLVDPPRRYLADPPKDQADRIARMRTGLELLAARERERPEPVRRQVSFL